MTFKKQPSKQVGFKTAKQYARHLSHSLLEAFEIGEHLKDSGSTKTKYKPISIEQLADYILARPGFNTFFGDWKRSKFKRHLRPKLNFDLSKLLKEEPQDMAIRVTTILLEDEEATFVDDIDFIKNGLVL